MPTAIRKIDKASKIASNLTGTPEPGKKRSKKKKSKIEQKVLFEETRRV